MTASSLIGLDDSSGKLPRRKWPHWCPNLSRIKLVGVVVIVTVATMLVTFQCVHPSVLRRGIFSCCPSQVQSQVTLETMSLLATESPDYDDEDDDKDGRQMHIRYKHTKRRLPQCLIIGARKAGTRALLQFLNLHPNIQIAKKEIHFFDDEDNYSIGLDWYRRQMPFSFPDQITLEKTPAYFINEDVPERVYNMNRTIKLLIIFRDPTERAISDYTQLHQNKLAKNKRHESFEELAMDPLTGEVRKSYNPIKRSIYHRHMERWLSYFPLKQFHFVHGENLVNNPVEELQKVETFLGLDHRIMSKDFCFNETKGFYCICNDTSQRCLSESKGRKHPDIDEQVIQKLQAFFRPHNNKLYQMIGRNFMWP